MGGPVWLPITYLKNNIMKYKYNFYKIKILSNYQREKRNKKIFNRIMKKLFSYQGLKNISNYETRWTRFVVWLKTMFLILKLKFI